MTQYKTSILQLLSVVDFSRSIHSRWRITLQDNDCRWRACTPRLPASQSLFK